MGPPSMALSRSSKVVHHWRRSWRYRWFGIAGTVRGELPEHVGYWVSKDTGSGRTRHARRACSSGCALGTGDASVCICYGSLMLDACSCVCATGTVKGLFPDAEHVMSDTCPFALVLLPCKTLTRQQTSLALRWDSAVYEDNHSYGSHR